MHSIQTGETQFFHNGDFSGDVTMVVHTSQIEEWHDDEAHVKVSFNDIRELVAQHYRRRMISSIEQATADAVLRKTIA